MARPLIEGGITAGWLGMDDARAVKLREKSAADVEKFLQRFVNAINGRPGTKVQGRQTGWPNLVERASAAGGWYARLYDLSYPRLSAATHGFDAALRTFQPGASPDLDPPPIALAHQLLRVLSPP